MKEQQVEDCAKIMANMSRALFLEHAGTIIERVEEVQLETDGGTGQVTVPLRMEVAFDGKEFSFRSWIDWKKTIKERFSVDPVTYNPNTEQLALPLNGGQEEEAGQNQQAGLKLVGASVNEIIDWLSEDSKNLFYQRVCGKGEEPLQLVESELDQYFASCADWKDYAGWISLIGSQQVAENIMKDDEARDGFISLVKSTLYPVNSGSTESQEPAAEKKTRKPRTPKSVPTATATPERCEFVHEKIGLQCIHNKGHEGKHGLNLCKHMHEDEVQFCILESGHVEEHKFADPATLN